MFEGRIKIEFLLKDLRALPDIIQALSRLAELRVLEDCRVDVVGGYKE